MNMIKTRRFFLAGLALATAMAFAPSARAQLYGESQGSSAETVTMSGTGALSSVNNTYDALYSTSLSPNSNGNGATGFNTSYCVDLTHEVASSWTQLGNTPTPLPLTNTFVTGTTIATDLAGFGRAAWIADAFGYGSVNNQTQAAVQVAIWVAEFAGSNYNPTTHTGATTITANAVNGGTITISGNNAVIQQAITYLQASWNAGLGAYASSSALWVNYENVTGSHPQFQLIAVAVPEPSALAIAGLGALGFVGYGLRRKRRQA
jgi:hypothetical protein